jgi:hypothetical protein
MATGLQQTVPTTAVTASTLVDWSAAWGKVLNYPSASVTLGTPLLFSTEDKGTNAINYVQQGSINWAKYNGSYTLGWTI